ncbi:hypothetical protein [Streptomyces sp. RKAG290]|uniref:hypothetical protein n=1 Tax=Streptomyces sp. RKAG290 TaxID=2888348 RepID=UPI0020332217|nr:hypothetical protein [Streptomyces sp. RKAG290]MCM2414821.1 hypothetical protein [Streptomyces sp. RKAG290]
MSRLLDACETTVSPSHRLFGLVDTSVDAFTPPPASSASWSGREEVEVALPEGELGVATVDDGVEEVPLVLPAAGTYRMRWQWAFNPENEPFTSPLPGPRDSLASPPGHEGGLKGKDQFCLVQVWRVAA